MIDTLLVYALALLLGWPLGLYLAKVMRGAPMRGDALFGWIERPLYRLLGTDPARGMHWRGYAGAFLASNLVLGVLVFALFVTQAWLPLNPDAVPNMRWDVALHTMVSFLTNTDQQHYSGQAQLSYLSQAVGVVGLQFVTPMMGLALVVATLRALFGGRTAAASGGTQQATLSVDEADVGNYWADVIRPTLRFLLPLCLLWTVLLTQQGVPSTLAAGPVATPLDGSAGMATQKIPLGPVAAMVAIKQLGTNGGGWYGPNSAVALENPTPFSNLLEALAIVLIPVAIAFMVGPFTGRRKFTVLVFGSMLAMSLASTAVSVWSEGHSASTASAALMEGKEVRFGVDASAAWSSLTTQTSNGSVNAMHDSLAPLTGGVAMINMLVNAIWGGIGCGLQQFLVYLLLSVFLAGLMTGRTPELFGRKIEAGEVRLLALLILLQPLVLLGFTALTLAMPAAITATSNPGFHGISQVFYEYTSAFANNGSGFEGLGDGIPWWNLTCTLVLILGRYPALIVPLIVAAQMARKRVAPETGGSLQVETPTFALTLIAVIAVLTVLQFTPALVLGPIADHLTLAAH
ncbi:potassium-transporting ATPase subunit KdpA [Xanthomonas graminis]|jgi:K+-transporting ATPase ATPase A chain|uniref:Potassium-transporting ATPase potassium-binding subunit n=1 Tax=Xanthomonas graminis pv. graminis TaxID=134874 RepID=A0A1M4IBW7_9XANT|nr:potassium-transporting ATPase subunit KdpA [Xanthomonas translucens]EKU26450.1 Potassium-transporting ATPase A chain [Xanthomonas translucens pv. graminis ART-Xtg29]OAX58604.1 potassium-transporting ATPase subunit KdpA [Xanthomonas translucens pv. graminis]UKE53894.1 potassium-transporting ATPase subunit KdpA [Xanthomonas translucens pv. graminis]WIH08211.1 potassium-transporting ATPase subunit KdpA [Xanthomonas translucens pv. graminis]WIH13037.1 potassium-transporting ATPase subunit KdpA 